jgi:hypothetical protein
LSADRTTDDFMTEVERYNARYVDPVTGDCRQQSVHCHRCRRYTFALDALCDRCYGSPR